ncbi:MAG: HAD hydrolase family protein, partial [Erysipelotrichaceae bacterium]
KEHISISLETVNSVYNINQHNNYIKKAFKYFKAPLPPIHSYNNEPIIMAVGYNYLGYDWQSFGSKVNLQVLTSASTHCDLLKYKVSKDTAIKEALNYLNLSNEEYMCFGDQMNDYDMIKNATYGVAVKDPLGSIELQSITALHANAPCNDGIFEYLVDIKLI